MTANQSSGISKCSNPARRPSLSGAYGFHGDEMYYIVAGQHPAFGYVDQPPLTPLLSAASVALLGVSRTAVRVLPALEIGLIVVLVALIVSNRSRELAVRNSTRQCLPTPPARSRSA
jgi:hypothetical protein